MNFWKKLLTFLFLSVLQIATANDLLWDASYMGKGAIKFVIGVSTLKLVILISFLFLLL